MTLAIIYSFYDNKKECFISNNMLGDMMGISRTTASEKVTKLESLGYIKCDRQMINGKEKRTIVPLRMVSLVDKPNPLVGKPTLLVGKPNRVSRKTDTSLVGEVGSIIQPLLLDKVLDNVPDNVLNNKIELEEELKELNKLIKEDKFNTPDERGIAYQKRYGIEKQIKELEKITQQ